MLSLIVNRVVATLRWYQKIISPLLGPRCRFYPSCSEYAISCLHTYSLPKAGVKVLWRLLCCNPFHSGGVDLP